MGTCTHVAEGSHTDPTAVRRAKYLDTPYLRANRAPSSTLNALDRTSELCITSLRLLFFSISIETELDWFKLTESSLYGVLGYGDAPHTTITTTTCNQQAISQLPGEQFVLALSRKGIAFHRMRDKAKDPSSDWRRNILTPYPHSHPRYLAFTDPR